MNETLSINQYDNCTGIRLGQLEVIGERGGLLICTDINSGLIVALAKTIRGDYMVYQVVTPGQARHRGWLVD